MIPLILGGAVVAAGATGIKKMLDASETNDTADHIRGKAIEIISLATEKCRNAQKRTEAALAEVGAKKKELWGSNLLPFVEIFRTLKNVELTGDAGVNELIEYVGDPEKLTGLEPITLQMAEVGSAAAGSAAAGALAGLAAYGGTGLFAAASTGTAISSLSGAAATNATLAWLGGGSLAAGGFGMAGGTVVMGGMVAGPALLFAGFIASAKADENYESARASRAEAKLEAERLDTEREKLDGITRFAEQVHRIMVEFQRVSRVAYDALQRVIDETHTTTPDFKNFTKQQREVTHLAFECAAVIKTLSMMPLLEGNDVNMKCAEVMKPLRKAQAGISQIA